jgi:gamma-glutamyl hercynylcysteine S-oxide synthase
MKNSSTSAQILRDWLLETRQRSRELYADLSAAQLLGPRLDSVNPPLWEIGHLGWFQEHWCLRFLSDDQELAPSILTSADPLYNSATVRHSTRWDLPLPNIEATQKYLDDVTERVLERLDHEPDNDALRYFAKLAVFHEDMHGEAFFYTRQTHGYSRPRLAGWPRAKASIDAAPGASLKGDAKIPGGRFLLGAARDTNGFVFDNEKWGHEIDVAPFRMAKAATTHGEFRNFVAADGYARREFWSDAGWAWRENARALHPLYWQYRDGEWYLREFDQWVLIDDREHHAVIFVNWFEAEAYCRFANRRLPTEAEWEFAASGTEKRNYPWLQQADGLESASRANLDGISATAGSVSAFGASDTPEGIRQLWGNVWEWTADWFAPYPGFVRDPYQEYSEPWFGDHKVLRGGCFATRSRLLRNTWRNFYTPDRRDVFAGFRTCALEQ